MWNEINFNMKFYMFNSIVINIKDIILEILK
jgi:hypothetical protein